MDDDAKTADRPPVRKNHDFLKIGRAIEDECSQTGITLETLLLLRPSERMKRLGQRMKDRGIKDDEMPKERRYRAFWKQLESEQRQEADASQES